MPSTLPSAVTRAPAPAPPPSLPAREAVALGLAILLAVAPNLPFLVSEAVAYGRFRNWAIFTGGLVVGAVLARARARLPSGTGPRR